MSIAFFRLGAYLFSGASVFVFVYRLAATESRQNERLGRRGMKRMEALAKSEGWATCEPFIRWLGMRYSGLLPRALERHLETQILYAGDYLGLLPQEILAICTVSAVVGLGLGAGLDLGAGTGGLAAMGFFTAGALGPYLQLSTLASERRLRIARSLPYAVDALTLAMSAGLDFPGGLRQFVSRAVKDDPLTEELEYLLQNLNLGHTRKSALRELAERVPTEAVKEFVHTVIQAEEKGTPLSDVLAIQATISRQRRTTRAEELAAKAGVKLSIPIGLLVASILALLVVPLMLKARSGLHGELGTPATHETIAPTAAV
ncbi:MAG: Type secretion system protein TadC, associated with Flp pilus assembly [Labilithrix sp.]|nr:Type secretion system protein TadC, associated with Flp pilus assembly [Labilithrix sp.]